MDRVPGRPEEHVRLADCTAAYTQALLWTITGNQTYAANAITILNAYGHNLKSYTNSNAPLQAAWGASKWARAAEIIRHSGAGWAPADATAFGQSTSTAPRRAAWRRRWSSTPST